MPPRLAQQVPASSKKGASQMLPRRTSPRFHHSSQNPSTEQDARGSDSVVLAPVLTPDNNDPCVGKEDEYASMQLEITPNVMDAMPPQCILEDPRNFYVTSYSPDPTSMETSPPSGFVFSTTSGLSNPPGRAVGPPVPPRIERILREVSIKHTQSKIHAVVQRQNNIPEIGALHPPYMEAQEADSSVLKMPAVAASTTAKPPKNVPGVAALHPPCRDKSGLPPRVPSSTSKQKSVPKKKGQPGVCSSRLRRVRGRVRPLWVYCTQPLPTFLQEAVSRT